MALRENLRILECLHCRFIYVDQVNTDPRRNDDFFNLHGKNIERWEKARSPQKQKTFSAAIQALDRILEKKQVEHICDVGCATGLFLDGLCSYFGTTRQACLCIDLSDQMLNFCAHKGYKVFKGNLFEIKQVQPHYDIISFMEVLEHVPYPRKDLEKAYELLRGGGGVLIEVPNPGFQYYKCKLEKILGRKTYGLMPEIHINLFEPRVLSQKLEKIGFRDISIVPRRFNMSNNRYYDYNSKIYLVAERKPPLSKAGINKINMLWLLND
jgi:2-polyprenyl-3-methyl-5-hydroxy-6-metoxy-1,4-benzoquinol methylase